MFSARRSYSSKTSCSSGVRSSFVELGSVMVDSEGSILEIGFGYVSIWCWINVTDIRGL